VDVDEAGRHDLAAGVHDAARAPREPRRHRRDGVGPHRDVASPPGSARAVHDARAPDQQVVVGVLRRRVAEERAPDEEGWQQRDLGQGAP
jgi:hypothetical protein